MNDKELAIGDAAYVIHQQDREPVIIRAFYTNPLVTMTATELV